MAHIGATALDTRSPVTAADEPEQPAPRGARLAAARSDIAWLAAGSLLTLAVAFGFLFWRTSWGAVDASAGDTAIAAALLLSVVPAWLAWMLVSLLEDGGTPGQRRRGLIVRPGVRAWPGAPLLRFALHPLSAPGWLWLAAIMFLVAAPSVGWLLIVAAAIVTLGGLGSAVLIALGRRALHDLLARTTVEARQ